jgi:ribosomal protein S18 acetylase RimI-like enzyme
VEARLATDGDVDELVRLRQVMFDALAGDHPTGDGWQEPTAEVLRSGLADGSIVAFVVDGPDGGLVSCGVGTVSQRIPGPANPSGRVGFVQSMATDPDHRGRGCARAVFTALMDGFRAQGLVAVDLHASTEGEPLYRSFGFREGDHPELQWRAGAEG